MFKRVFLLATLAIPGTVSAQFHAGRLPATNRDSFEVMIQGRPFGTYIMSHSRTGENFTLVTVGNLQGGMTLIDTVVFNATTFAPVLFATSQAMAGMSAGGRITIANGKAMGTIQQAGPGGVQSMPVNAAVPTGAIADGADALLIPTIDFSEGLSLTFQTFDGKSGKTKNYTMKVVGKEQVTVPAGAFEAWKTELASDEPAVIWVTTSEPRKILMLRIESQQLEMRRASK